MKNGTEEVISFLENSFTHMYGVQPPAYSFTL